ncbi:NifB/NifX family molybdenum-iron cluster-binding protein [bacterium]|nr:NifB/NifX family molybdenum-iron cluster-binding protein [bacterium]
MKICFTADEKRGLESILSYHFGHCPYYVIVDVENNVVKNVDSVENPMAENHNPGDLPNYMKGQGINVIVTGGMGAQAQDMFKGFDIQTVTGAYGVLQDVLEEFLKNKITVQESDPEIEVPHIEGEDDTTRRLKMDVMALRKEIADLKSAVKKIEEKLN